MMILQMYWMGLMIVYEHYIVSRLCGLEHAHRGLMFMRTL